MYASQTDSLIAQYRSHSLAAVRLLRARRAHGKAHGCQRSNGKLPTCPQWLRFEACSALVLRRRAMTQRLIGRDLLALHGWMTPANEAEWQTVATELDTIDYMSGLRHPHEVAENGKRNHLVRWPTLRAQA